MFSSRGARVVSINLDEPPRAKVVRGFSAQQGFTFPIVMNKTTEKNYEIDKPYLVKGTPTSYLIDREGIIVDSHYGPMTPPEMEASLKKLTE